jgi:hypothetical protein
VIFPSDFKGLRRCLESFQPTIWASKRPNNK